MPFSYFFFVLPAFHYQSHISGMFVFGATDLGVLFVDF
jgi:hypothetical protein